MTADGGRRQTARGSRSGLTGRLLTALALVLVTAGVTAWLVAGVVGPPIFHEHMLRSDVEATGSAVSHAEEAFLTAGALSLLIALGTAALVALGVSLFLTRRIGASLGQLTSAAQLVAGGRFEARVPDPGMGPELDELAGAFNHMAARLDESEGLRRRLLSDVAHELRTPVATLSAQLESIEDGVVPLDEATIQVLRDQGARLTRLAEDLAAVTRAESGDVRLDVSRRQPAELVAAAAAAVGPRAEAAGVAVVTDAPADLPALLVDPERIAQVLGNLLDNAVRHTPAGGTVTLGARAARGRVELTVRDTGEGIGAQHLPHVFERFYRADDARDRHSGGSGIGLAITKALVEAHGGTVRATSEGRGHGSTFVVSLPAAPAAPVR
ncbi:cell wall metabolism sensor histidine kinase WalK [Actinotalea sp. Marseille-Q4924]|uniref:sensor histidine kinase n=1 Tax=Actinotalea sp. Marseille-Q4924 TaxID=2866571 RepID=UPI001CE48166|nr:HAMP domain-containing sensor histidine kinase [Actinotalea sp. Marseille-Q4924]